MLRKKIYRYLCCFLCIKHAYLRNPKLLVSVEGDERIIRQCATAGTPGHPCTQRTGTRKIKMKYCECEKDLCNAASRNFRLPLQSLGLSFFIVLFGILIV